MAVGSLEDSQGLWSIAPPVLEGWNRHFDYSPFKLYFPTVSDNECILQRVLRQILTTVDQLDCTLRSKLVLHGCEIYELNQTIC